LQLVGRGSCGQRQLLTSRDVVTAIKASCLRRRDLSACCILVLATLAREIGVYKATLLMRSDQGRKRPFCELFDNCHTSTPPCDQRDCFPSFGFCHGQPTVVSVWENTENFHKVCLRFYTRSSPWNHRNTQYRCGNALT